MSTYSQLAVVGVFVVIVVIIVTTLNISASTENRFEADARFLDWINREMTPDGRKYETRRNPKMLNTKEMSENVENQIETKNVSQKLHYVMLIMRQQFTKYCINIVSVLLCILIPWMRFFTVFVAQL